MRGAAIPLLVWALVLGVLFGIHWVWTGDTLQTATFGFAVGLILACAVVAVAGDRDTIRRGAPHHSDGPQAVPAASVGALLTAIAVIACGFGLVFGAFLVFIAAGLFVIGTGVLGMELISERRARRQWTTRKPRP